MAVMAAPWWYGVVGFDLVWYGVAGFDLADMLGFSAIRQPKLQNFGSCHKPPYRQHGKIITPPLWC